MDHLHSLFDRALDAVVGMDSRGRVIAWNRAAEDLFGWAKMDVMGQSMSGLIIPNEHRRAHSRGLLRYNKTGQGPVLEKRIRITALDRQGHEFPVELSIFPMRQQGGDVFYAFIRSFEAEEAHRRELEMRAQEGEVLFAAAAALLDDMSMEDFTRLCLAKVCEVAGLDAAHVFYVRHENGSSSLVSSGIWFIAQECFRPVIEDTASRNFRQGEGLPGKAWSTGEVAAIADISEAPEFLRRESFSTVGLTRAIAVPIVHGHQTYGIMEFFGTGSSRLDRNLIRLVRTVAKNVGLAIQKMEAAKQRDILRRELAHRVGNSMAILAAIFRASSARASSVAELSKSFSASLSSVARAHREFTRTQSSVGFESVLEEALGLLPDKSRLELDLPAFIVPVEAVLPLSLVFVELVTNHLKHAPEEAIGVISVTHQFSPDRDNFVLRWKEFGGADLNGHVHSEGYGSFVIRSMIEDRLKGRFDRRFAEDGMSFEMVLPTESVVMGAANDAEPGAAGRRESFPAPGATP